SIVSIVSIVSVVLLPDFHPRPSLCFDGFMTRIRLGADNHRAIPLSSTSSSGLVNNNRFASSCSSRSVKTTQYVLPYPIT
ncbi:hypothetical protein, partial [Vibrio lentus]